MVLESILTDLLIVEDNSFIGQSIVNATRKHESIGALHLTETLQEAISFLNVTNFGVIVLDLSLPDGSGLELLKIIKEKKIKTKVFVFSVNTELKSICLRYGAAAFFDKSNDFDKLIETIKAA